MRELVQEINRYLRDHNSWESVDYDGYSQAIVCEINWGDWKHEHARTDFLMRQFFDAHSIYQLDRIETETTETDGSDAYSATHYYYISERKGEPGGGYDKPVVATAEPDDTKFIPFTLLDECNDNYIPEELDELDDDYDTSLIEGSQGTDGCIEWLTVTCPNCNLPGVLEDNAACLKCGTSLIDTVVQNVLDDKSKCKLIYNGDMVSKACSDQSGKNGLYVTVDKEFFDHLPATIHDKTTSDSTFGAFKISELKDPLKSIIMELRGWATQHSDPRSSDQVTMDFNNK